MKPIHIALYTGSLGVESIIDILSRVRVGIIEFDLTNQLPDDKLWNQKGINKLFEVISTADISEFTLNFGHYEDEDCVCGGFSVWSSDVINALSRNRCIRSVHIMSDYKFDYATTHALINLITNTTVVTSLSITSPWICGEIFNALKINRTINKLTIYDSSPNRAANESLYSYIDTATCLKHVGIYFSSQSVCLEKHLIANKHIRHIATVFQNNNLIYTIARISKTLRTLKNYGNINTALWVNADEQLIRQLSDNYCITTCDIVPSNKKYAIQLEEILNRNRALMQEDYHADITNIVIALYPIVCRYSMDSYLITDIIDYVDGQYFEINRFRKEKLIASIKASMDKIKSV